MSANQSKGISGLKSFSNCFFKLLVSLLCLSQFLIISAAHAAEVSPKDCTGCANLKLEISRKTSEIEELKKKITSQRQALSKMSTDDDTERMAATTNLFVLLSKVETAANWREVQSKEMAARCKVCR